MASSTFGIDGLASGLQSSQIITQLLQLERQPAVRMERTISRHQSAISSLQSLSTAFKAIEEAAKALTGPAETFTPTSATSSADYVVATASDGAAQGSFTFSVEQLAATHRVVSGGQATATTDVVATANSTVDITIDGVTTSVDTGDGTLATLAANINDAGIGVSASIVNTGSGFKLQIGAVASGAANTFSVDTANLDAGFSGGGAELAVLTQGQDAEILVGDGPGAYTVTSASNTFNDVVEGVSFSVSEARPAEPVTVTVEPDTDALVDEVRSMVDRVNEALAELDAGLANDPEGNKGIFAGDSVIRGLRDGLLGAVTYAVSGTYHQSGGLIGIQSTREGTLSFDEEAFRSAFEERPDDVIAMFRSDDANNPGIAQRLESLAEITTEFNTGTIATAVAARESTIDNLEDAVDRVDLRIELRRASLERQFANLEVVLSGLQSQGQWLAGQIASLPTYSSGN